MKSTYQHFNNPPATPKGPNFKSDNLALVPASLLPFKHEYQAIANGLPQGDILVVIPANKTVSDNLMEKVISGFENRGHKVTTLPAQQFS